jgi:hypothetical protein
MTSLSRIRRALVLVLLLPALLAPSGWALRVCFCEAMAAAADEESCCTTQAHRCCEDEANPGNPGEHRCGECKWIRVGNAALQPRSNSDTAVMALPAAVRSAPLIVRSYAPVARPICRSGEPPGRVRALPLRI